MKAVRILIIVLLAAVVAGCETEDARDVPTEQDERLAEAAAEAADRQAEQNIEMARVQSEANRTVQAALDEQRESREMLAQMQQRLEQRQTAIDQRHDTLEQERQRIAAERRWDTRTATVLLWLGEMMIAVSPLLLVAMLARRALSKDGQQEARDEIIIETFRPMIRPSPPIPLKLPGRSKNRRKLLK